MPPFLPGQNTALTERLEAENWIPVEPTRGGVKTLYPATFGAPAGEYPARATSKPTVAIER